MSKVSFLLGFSIMLAVASGIIGCENGSSPSSSETAVTISPSPGYINSSQGGSVQFSASGGSSNYTWSLANSSLGSLSPAGATANYHGNATIGTNTIMVTDSLNTSNTASALIMQQPPGESYWY